DFLDEFGLLVDRNIFMSDRHRTPPPQRIERVQQTPEQANIVTGIVFREGEWFTFVEDTQAYRNQRLRVGDSVANGKISDIESDRIGFVNAAGKKIWVTVGSNFTGSAADVSSAQIDSALGSADNAANLTIEQQLRLKRLQAMNPGLAASGDAQPMPAADAGG